MPMSGCWRLFSQIGLRESFRRISCELEPKKLKEGPLSRASMQETVLPVGSSLALEVQKKVRAEVLFCQKKSREKLWSGESKWANDKGSFWANSEEMPLKHWVALTSGTARKSTNVAGIGPKTKPALAQGPSTLWALSGFLYGISEASLKNKCQDPQCVVFTCIMVIRQEKYWSNYRGVQPCLFLWLHFPNIQRETSC